MSALAPGVTSTPNLNTITGGIEKLQNQANAYNKASEGFEIEFRVDNDSYELFSPRFGKYKEKKSTVDKFDSFLKEKRIALINQDIGLEVERLIKKEKLKKEILILFLQAIQDGVLTDQEKKEILKKLKQYKAIVNFLSFNYSGNKTINKVTLDSDVGDQQINSLEVTFNIEHKNELKPRVRELFEIAYKKIENDYKKRDNLAAADEKITNEEQKDQTEAKVELDEIKKLGNKILETL